MANIIPCWSNCYFPSLWVKITMRNQWYIQLPEVYLHQGTFHHVERIKQIEIYPNLRFILFYFHFVTRIAIHVKDSGLQAHLWNTKEDSISTRISFHVHKNHVAILFLVKECITNFITNIFWTMIVTTLQASSFTIQYHFFLIIEVSILPVP